MNRATTSTSRNQRHFRVAGGGACANELAHPGVSIRPRSLVWFGLALLGVAAGCGGTTNDVATTRSTEGGIETGGHGNGGAGGGAGGTSGRSSGGQAGAGNAPTGGSAGNAGSGSGGITGDGGSSSGGSAGAPGGAAGTGGATGRVPVNHRATGATCDNARPAFDAGAPRGDAAVGPPVACRTHEDCTAGDNGRCVGNGHDGWRCTYDACFTDADCPASDGGPNGGRAGVCVCENGFRSDNNTCLYNGNCRTDADCGGSYCSPTLGQCGRYGTFVGFYCHSAADECIDDADCAGTPNAYCAWSELKGHWACSTSFCVG